MNDHLLLADTTVWNALQWNPAIQEVLNEKRTSCVGCCMARFCTLRDAATAYELPWDAFIGELRSVIVDPNSVTGGIGA
jgi:hypothetical protein